MEHEIEQEIEEEIEHEFKLKIHNGQDSRKQGLWSDVAFPLVTVNNNSPIQDYICSPGRSRSTY